MKDIFFGCSKTIARYGYMRHDLKNIQGLRNKLQESSILILNSKTSNSSRLEVLISANNLINFSLSEHKVFSDVVKDWLQFNELMNPIVSKKEVYDYAKIDKKLTKLPIFWLGYDDIGIAVANGEETTEKYPVFAIDISESPLLKGYADDLITNQGVKWSNGNKEILNLKNEVASMYSYGKMYIDFIKKNNFCPSCGGHVVAVNLGSRLYCLNDSNYEGDDKVKCEVNLRSNNLQYPRTDAVVIIALYDEKNDRILLGSNTTRHPVTEKVGEDSRIYRNTFYSCFSGFMEPGETIEYACMREVYEETGLKINANDIKIIESQPWPFPANLMIGCLGILRDEQLNDENINIELDKELDNVQWFDSKIVKRVLNGEIKGVISEDDKVVNQWNGPPVESVAGRLIQIAINESAKGKL